MEKTLKRVRLEELRDNLTARDYELFRQTAVAQCNITSATWSNWVNGKVRPTAKYHEIINTIAASYGLSVFGTEAAVEGGER